MRYPSILALCATAALSAGCTASPKASMSTRPSDAHIEAQVRASVERMTAGVTNGAILEGLEINKAGTVACGVVTTEGQPRLILLSLDLDFSDDRRASTFGIMGEAEDFASPGNQRLAELYLNRCRSHGLLTSLAD